MLEGTQGIYSSDFVAHPVVRVNIYQIPFVAHRQRHCIIFQWEGCRASRKGTFSSASIYILLVMLALSLLVIP